MTSGVLWGIYGLRLANNWEYRYVGLTRIGLEARLKTHKYDANSKGKRHVCKWVAKYASSIVIDLLEECPVGDNEYLFEAEQYWISQVRGFGHNLTNASDGGASGSYGARWTLSPDQIRSGNRHPNYGRPATAEHIEKLAIARRGTKLSEETRNKMSVSRTGQKHWNYGKTVSDSTKQKISDTLKGREMNEETRKKMSESRKGIPKTPDQIEKMRLGRIGVKHKVSAWNKGLPNPSAHIRYHTNKGVSKPETCKFCKTEDSNGSY